MSKKILIIDDDPDLTEALQTLLEASGYTVLSAENGVLGFNKALKEIPNLIILDVMMTTKTEGLEIAKKLNNNKETKNIPVILVTGVKSDMNLPFGFEPDEDWLPVKEVIEKPVKPRKFLQAVNMWIS